MADSLLWKAEWKVDKFHGEKDDHYDQLIIPGNLLTYGGASSLWQYSIGLSPVAYLNNANAHLGVGDSSAVAAATQTDLQAAVNKHYEPMDATYPQHSDGTGSATNAQIVWKSTYELADANFTWNEMGLFTAVTPGRMINRKVVAAGTKTAADTWELTLTVTLA